jgi:hypothetical protein
MGNQPIPEPSEARGWDGEIETEIVTITKIHGSKF